MACEQGDAGGNRKGPVEWPVAFVCESMEILGLIPTTPLYVAVPFRWLWATPGECSVTGRAHLQRGQECTAEVLADAVGHLCRRSLAVHLHDRLLGMCP